MSGGMKCYNVEVLEQNHDAKMLTKIVLTVNLDGINCDLELTQIDEEKVSLAVYRDHEEDGLRRESTFTCDRIELINALQKLPQIDKLVNG